jgi:hypothetical protein
VKLLRGATEMRPLAVARHDARRGGEWSMAAKEGYCVKCKAKKDIKDPKDITMKNGRPATQGLCPDCGTKIFKIGK